MYYFIIQNDDKKLITLSVCDICHNRTDNKYCDCKCHFNYIHTAWDMAGCLCHVLVYDGYFSQNPAQLSLLQSSQKVRQKSWQKIVSPLQNMKILIWCDLGHARRSKYRMHTLFIVNNFEHKKWLIPVACLYDYKCMYMYVDWGFIWHGESDSDVS